MSRSTGDAPGLAMNDAVRAVVIGASAGAMDALSVILPPLERDYPLPILLVVHVPADKRSLLAELLDSKCKVRVREAQDKEPIEPGTVYVAPPDYHLLVEREARLSLSNEEPVLYSRPSIDVLFESAADVYGTGLLGVVLTGANSDGANGLAAICEAGGQAIVQRPETASSPTMPAAALSRCPGALVLDLEQISRHLRELPKVK